MAAGRVVLPDVPSGGVWESNALETATGAESIAMGAHGLLLQVVTAACPVCEVLYRRTFWAFREMSHAVRRANQLLMGFTPIEGVVGEEPPDGAVVPEDHLRRRSTDAVVILVVVDDIIQRQDMDMPPLVHSGGLPEGCLAHWDSPLMYWGVVKDRTSSPALLRISVR